MHLELEAPMQITRIEMQRILARFCAENCQGAVLGTVVEVNVSLF